MRFHAIQNVETALRFLRYKEIKLVNIRGEDIVDGNPKLTLGLIWTIILHFQVGKYPKTSSVHHLFPPKPKVILMTLLLPDLISKLVHAEIICFIFANLQIYSERSKIAPPMTE